MDEVGLIVAAALVAVAAVNGAIWIGTHTVARHWKEVAEFDVLTDFPGSTDALSRLHRHLVSTYLAHFDHNEAIVRRSQRLVGAQAVFALLFVYSLPFVWLLL